MVASNLLQGTAKAYTRPAAQHLNPERNGSIAALCNIDIQRWMIKMLTQKSQKMHRQIRPANSALLGKPRSHRGHKASMKLLTIIKDLTMFTKSSSGWVDMLLNMERLHTASLSRWKSNVGDASSNRKRYLGGKSELGSSV